MSAKCPKLTQGLLFVAALILETAAVGADTDFYQIFVEAKSKTNGFLYETSLVDTNNSGPNLTNAPIPFTKFSHEGELAGIKLGMTMSEVVSAWGKPSSLFTHCGFGPRFWYGSRHYGNVSLSFVGDRLVLMVITGSMAKHVALDNGLKGNMSQAAWEKVLGQPTLRDPDFRGRPLFTGEIAYRNEAIRIDLLFETGKLAFIAVSLEEEAKSKKRQQVEQSGER